MTPEEAIHKAAALRGTGRYDEAIALVESNLPTNELRVVALLQAFYAAEQKGDTSKARQFAEQIKETDPLLPAIKKYLVD
jgi:uncharacterized protein HemY